MPRRCYLRHEGNIGSNTFSMYRAGVSPHVPACAASVVDEVWISFRPPCGGQYTFSACGTSTPLYLAAYDSCTGLASRAPLGCSATCTLTVTLAANQRAFVRVGTTGGVSALATPYSLTVSADTCLFECDDVGSSTGYLKHDSGYQLGSATSFSDTLVVNQFDACSFPRIISSVDVGISAAAHVGDIIQFYAWVDTDFDKNPNSGAPLLFVGSSQLSMCVLLFLLLVCLFVCWVLLLTCCCCSLVVAALLLLATALMV